MKKPSLIHHLLSDWNIDLSPCLWLEMSQFEVFLVLSEGNILLFSHCYFSLCFKIWGGKPWLKLEVEMGKVTAWIFINASFHSGNELCVILMRRKYTLESHDFSKSINL